MRSFAGKSGLGTEKSRVCPPRGAKVKVFEGKSRPGAVKEGFVRRFEGKPRLGAGKSRFCLPRGTKVKVFEGK